MSRIVLGVSGGVALQGRPAPAPSPGRARRPRRAHAGALHFVGAATFEALSGNPVTTDVWSDVPEVAHVRIGQNAELVVVAPATADLLARAATGRADDLLTATLLTASSPVVFVPAMHTEMWLHPATQDNVATLRRRGAIVLPPAVGRLTGPDSGPGRLPVHPTSPSSPRSSSAPAPTPSPTTSPDGGSSSAPEVRASRSTRSATWATAPRACRAGPWPLSPPPARRGRPVAANVELPAPFGVRVVPVGTAEEFRGAMLAEASGPTSSS